MAGGSKLWLLAGSTDEWRTQLRMPLLQRWLAGRLGAPDSDVTVGFCFFFTSAAMTRHASRPRAIDAALDEVRQLVALA